MTNLIESIRAEYLRYKALAEAAILAWLLSMRLSHSGSGAGLARLSRSLVGFLAAALPMGAVSY
ncbi:MAG: hypothetical protein ABR585_09935, partial [Gemmatimonadaceae bacterium]